MAKGDITDIGYVLILIAVLGLLLVFLNKPLSEGFSGSIRCDVDSPCSGHLKCINGFCAKTETVGITESNPVEVLPDGEPVPYFS